MLVWSVQTKASYVAKASLQGVLAWAWAQGGLIFYRGGDKVIKWNILAKRLLAIENLLRICLNQ